MTSPRLESLAINLLKDMPSSDIAAILREADGGSEASLTAAITSNHRKGAPRLTAADVPVPRVLTSPPEQEAFVAAAHAEAERVAEGKPARTLAASLPQLVRAAGQRAKTAGAALATLSAESAAALEEVADAVARRDHDLGRFQSLATLTKTRRQLLFRERFLVAAEAVAISLAIASFLGLTDDYGGPAPLSAWLSGASLAASAVLAGWGLAWVGAKLLGTGPLPKRLGLLAGLGLGAASIAFAAALGFIRYAGADSRLSEGAATAGSIGLAVIVGLCSAVVFITCLITRRQLLALDAEFADVTRRAETHGRTIERLGAASAEAATREDAAVEEARIVDLLETAFEAAVQLIASALRAYNAILPDRLARAVGAWRTLKGLSAPEREMVATTAFRLVPANGAPSTPSATGVLRTLTVLLVTLGTLSLFSCTDHRPPNVVTVICDPSGAAPEEVCTPLLLARAFRALVEAAPPLGSRFGVIFPGQSVATTVATDPLVVVPRSRADRQAWIDRSVTTLGSEALPNLPASDRDDVSDLIGALLVASSNASAFPADRHTLVIASDGLIVSTELGINCERRVPTARALITRLTARHVALDLSLFAGGITICGFSNAGLSASALQARAALWRALIAASHGGTPVVLPSCRGLYPDAAPRLP